MTFHSSPRSCQQKHAAAKTDSKSSEAKMTKGGETSRGIDQFRYPWVRKVAEQAFIMIRRQTLFNNPFPEDLDEMAAAVWIKAC